MRIPKKKMQAIKEKWAIYKRIGQMTSEELQKFISECTDEVLKNAAQRELAAR